MVKERELALETREIRDEDWAGVAGLVNHYEHEGLTGEIMLARSNRWTPTDPRMQLVTVDVAGRIVGHARSLRRASDVAGKFSVIAYVDETITGQGLGRRLLQMAEDFAAANGAKHLISYVREDCARGVAVALKNGFELNQHLFDSTVDLTAFDPAPWLTGKEALEAAGYRFFTMAEAGYTDGNRHRLYKLDVITDVDTPGFENWGKRSYEQYLRDEHESYAFTADGVFIAEFAGEWVGMSALRPAPRAGRYHIDYTGVLREHRGKGLSTVLKALSMQYAKGNGGQVLETSNDERNAAMLNVNVKMGFVPEPGFYVCRKELG